MNDHELAVWGYGNDDEWLIPARLHLRCSDGSEVRWFAGQIAKSTLTFDKTFFPTIKKMACRFGT